MVRRCLTAVCAAMVFASCGGADPGRRPDQAAPPRVAWAIAIHGGAGTVPRTLPEERKQAYLDALDGALGLGREMLERGDSSLDVVDAVIRRLEDEPLFNAGRGAVFNHEGGHELDAAIMDGRDLACGAVAGVSTVKNPISLARLVMERTRHVLLTGPGAEAFADEMGVERVDPTWFDTESRREAWQRALEEERAEDDKGTVGVAALDRAGNLAAGTSTGGLTNKKLGRVGDTPIVGAGTYADNRTCAVSATGIGEEFIRHGATRAISAWMQIGGLDLDAAARRVVHETLRPGDGGVVAVAHDGTIAMVFNTEGMYRAAADANGRYEVKIWE